MKNSWLFQAGDCFKGGPIGKYLKHWLLKEAPQLTVAAKWALQSTQNAEDPLNMLFMLPSWMALLILI